MWLDSTPPVYTVRITALPMCVTITSKCTMSYLQKNRASRLRLSVRRHNRIVDLVYPYTRRVLSFHDRYPPLLGMLTPSNR